MVHFLGYTVEDLYVETAGMAREQGITTQEGWNDIVEAVIEDHREFEEVHDDDETEFIKAELRGRWPDYAATLSSEKPF